MESQGNNLFFFIALFAGLFVLWLVTGGPDRTPSSTLFGTSASRGEVRDATALGLSGAQERQDLEETVFDTQEELKKLEEELKQARIKGTASPYEGMVTLRTGRARDRYAQTEYLELSASSRNTIDVPITGWRIESVVTGQGGTIGSATSLPYPGVSNTISTLFLSPGDRAYVVTGRSPIGVNFKVNQCVGYFEQYQDFAPRLRKDCADPADEFDEFATLPVTNVRLENDDREVCRAFIRRNVDRCEINTIKLKDVRPALTQMCKDFIDETYTYSGCVQNHRYDRNFFSDEWRIFLGSYAELWREKREIIRLLDQNGRTVDILDY
jgi:hypothetical protein